MAGHYFKYKTSPPPTPHGVASAATTSYTPLPSPVPGTRTCMSAAAKRWKYLRRLFKFQQMDFEFALWQMLYLFVAPQKVYRQFQYRKQTKAQYARDDPAFLVLLSCWLLISSAIFSLVLKFNFSQFCIFTLYVIFVDCIGVGLLVGTLLWFISNRFLRKPTCKDQDVEWGYAFDVHLNAFFPLLIILHVFQLLFYRIFYESVHISWYLGLLCGNSFWLLAVGYYIYITFLGYNAVPILRNTNYLLIPMTLLFFFYILSLCLGWNICLHVINFYIRRV